MIPKLEQESVNTVCFSKYYEDRLKNFTSPINLDLELDEISYAVGICIYRWTTVSAVSVICSLPQPEKNLENQRNKQFIDFKMHAKQEGAIMW